MGKFKTCPRTGMIIRGPGPFRPPAFPVTQAKNRPKSDNAFPAKPARTGEIHYPEKASPQQETLTSEKIQEIAEAVGKAIAAQIQSIPVEAKISLPANFTQHTVQHVREKQSQGLDITIDESIIDVGIGNQDKLEKGELSGSIAKKATKKSQLGNSLAKLKKLKGG